MFRVAILSPHRDDAIFSLFGWLSVWQQRRVELQVINFFTESNYAPQAVLSQYSKISDIRKREDRTALRAIGHQLEVLDGGLLDAPLRLDIPVSAVCSCPASLPTDELAFDLVKRLHSIGKALVVAPLALGTHVDHLSVHTAALQAISEHRLAFYEDLPYATWTPEDVVREFVKRTSRVLTPILLKQGSLTFRKRRAAARYKSQIVDAEADCMAAWTAAHGGERLWIPGHSRHWRQLVAVSNEFGA